MQTDLKCLHVLALNRPNNCVAFQRKLQKVKLASKFSSLSRGGIESTNSIQFKSVVLLKPVIQVDRFPINGSKRFFINRGSVKKFPAMVDNHVEGFSIAYEDVLKASRRITAAGGWETPILTSQSLDELATHKAGVKRNADEEKKDSERALTRRLFFKVEAFQRTGSFKFRGAANAISEILEKHQLEDRYDNSERILHVVTHSAGNHAQGLALAAKLLSTSPQSREKYGEFKVYATVVMPRSAPQLKIDAVKSYGAQVILVDDIRSTREREADRIVQHHIDQGREAVLIPPFENTSVMAGQGTVALEMIYQVRQWLREERELNDVSFQSCVISPYEEGRLCRNPLDLDAVIIPVGGGALASGCSIVIRHILGGSEKVKIILVEPTVVNDTQRGFQLGHRVGHPSSCNIQDTIADGLRAELGPMQWPILYNLADSVITVTEPEIMIATKMLWERLKVMVEPSAAVGLAAVLTPEFNNMYKLSEGDCARVGIILCGGNCDVAKVAKLIDAAT